MNAARGAASYYARVFVPLALETVIWHLGTMRGAFPLRQREIAMRRVRYDGAGEYWDRKHVYADAAQVEAALTNGCVLTLDFGPVYPPHSLPPAGTPLPDLVADVNVWDARPYDFVRARAMPDGAACAWGEMVLDVDLEHDPLDPAKYDRSNVCACGGRKQVCDRCWHAFLEPAQKALLWMVRTFFGFRRVFCVFSGRRGFHMWVCDARVVRMTQPERVSLVQALRRPFLSSPSPLEDGVYGILGPHFDSVPELRMRYQEPSDPCLRERAHRAAVFDALWPRIDEAVALDARHLHKAPLVLHTETTHVCVVMGDPWDETERFVPSQDSFPAHEVEQSLLEAVVAGSAAKLRKILSE